LQVVWEVLHPEEALYPVCSLVGYKWFWIGTKGTVITFARDNDITALYVI
jgi:hypothetical protein